MENKPATLPPKAPPTATRINDQGLVEVVDLFTGKVVAVQSSPNDDFLTARFDNLVEIETPDGQKVWIEKHLDPGRILRHIASQKKTKATSQFSLAWGQLLAGHLLDGDTLTRACVHTGLRLSTVKRWMLESADFKAIIDQAKVMRAETLQDEALDAARHHQKNEPKLHVDTLMKQAALADPEQFNPKTKVEHSGEIAHTFVIETGIRRNQPIPLGFEDAIRDATPSNLPQQSHPEVTGFADYDEGSSRSSGNTSTLEAESRAPEETKERESKSILDIARESRSSYSSTPIKNLSEDSEF